MFDVHHLKQIFESRLIDFSTSIAYFQLPIFISLTYSHTVARQDEPYRSAPLTLSLVFSSFLLASRSPLVHPREFVYLVNRVRNFLYLKIQKRIELYFRRATRYLIRI